MISRIRILQAKFFAKSLMLLSLKIQKMTQSVSNMSLQHTREDKSRFAFLVKEHYDYTFKVAISLFYSVT